MEPVVEVEGEVVDKVTVDEEVTVEEVVEVEVEDTAIEEEVEGGDARQTFW